MTTTFTTLRNTISKQTKQYTEKEAERILNHPVFGKVNEVVRVNKPEVLSQPHILDDDGNRKPIESKKDGAKVDEPTSPDSQEEAE